LQYLDLGQDNLLTVYNSPALTEEDKTVLNSGWWIAKLQRLQFVSLNWT